MIDELNLNVSHFQGQGWNKGNFDYSRFRKGNAIKIANALSALKNLRENQCECCKSSTWNNQQILLEIHHKDGDHAGIV